LNTSDSIQAFLDSLAQVPGSIVYRDVVNWVGLPPGDPGDILTVGNDNRPGWGFSQVYFPAMQKYDGASGSYDIQNVTLSGNDWTAVVRVTVPEGDVNRDLLHVSIASNLVFHVFIEGGHVLAVRAKNSEGSLILRAKSNMFLDDNVPHTVFVDYQALTPSLQMIVDGHDVVDLTWPLHILTSGTLLSGNGYRVTVGSFNLLAEWFTGNLGYVGLKQERNLDWTRFMFSGGAPKKLDDVSWAEWSGQPLIWHESGKLDENRGSLGPLTKVGSIVISKPETWF